MEKLWRKDDKLVMVDDLFEMWVKIYYLLGQDTEKNDRNTLGLKGECANQTLL